jgi:precorrin-6Y C5,15-methyltransferase (decarboxylating) CbiT subunit
MIKKTQQLGALGLPDSCFIRGEAPMTKQEIRWLTLCKARIEPSNCIWDIGAGTGSISVEAARLAPQGLVYAIEKDLGAIDLIKDNAMRFQTANLEAVSGFAPQALTDLPDPDRIIISGSGGAMEAILDCCTNRLRPKGLIVFNAITVDNLNRGISYFKSAKWHLEGIMTQISRLEEAKEVHMWKALNPVQIIVATREAANAW